MVLISGKYKQAAGIVSKEVVVEHCAFTESPTSNWLVDVKCRTGGSDWKSLSKANPKAEVQMKTNDISITLPPLREDTEIAVFGKPGEHDLKRMQMYVFGAKPVQGRNWMIYVYICDDTDMAFENLCENEKRKGNKLLTAGAGLFVPNNNKNVSVELNALEPGWQIKGSSIKTVESRDVWNSPENATDFPSLSFEIHHVDKTRQSFFCAITASNETKATAEIMAVFKKEKETDGPHKEYKRFHHKPDVKFCGGLGHSCWNELKPLNGIALMLVFSIILSGLKMKVGHSQHQNQIVRRTETTTIEIWRHTGAIYRAPNRGHIFPRGSGGVTRLQSTIETKGDAVEHGTIGPIYWEQANLLILTHEWK